MSSGWRYTAITLVLAAVVLIVSTSFMMYS